MTVTTTGTSPYTATFADDPTLLRAAPIAIDGLAERDWPAYRRYIDRSCDLTMRGGTTSGVVYPLAVCALAEHYLFRSVGGASAGAIAASATAAAELGRAAAPADGPTKTALSVGAGFQGLREVVGWLTGSDAEDREDWRLAQLFQPAPATHRLFRVMAASMQSNGPRGTGKSKLRCLAVALPAMLGPFSLLAVAITIAVWLTGPTMMALLPPSRWTAWPAWVQWAAVGVAVAAVVGIVVALYHGAETARLARQHAGKESAATSPNIVAGAVVGLPLLAGLIAFVVRSVLHDGALFPGLAWWAAGSATVVLWFVLSLSAAGVLTVVLGLGMSHFLTKNAGTVNFGLVSGTTAPKRGFVGRFIDRAAGMPKSTGVPGLSEWLADRLDDLAGVPYPARGQHRHALTFGDLWCGTLAHSPDEAKARCDDRRQRVVNLELMTTNLSQGRPYRLPFAGRDQAALFGGTTWMFCGACLSAVLPKRVVDQLVAAAPSDPAPGRPACDRHPDTPLRRLPEPWDVPVVLAARMSLSLPGLVSAVPLHSAAPPESGRTGYVPQWFSDGGITSNFPIHFFDSLLPRWPTFGLNLQKFPPGPEQEAVFVPPQDTTTSTEAWAPIGSAIGFFGAILDTFLGWRDTMQSALPGFRGRIAHVRQRPWEGGTNLFMPRELIQGLADRGWEAGVELRDRFTGQDGEVAGPQTQTDRYRWIRMRLAMRKYGELAHEIDDGAPLYRSLAERYEVPAELGAWFADSKLSWPQPDPGGAVVAKAVVALADLAHQGQPLAERIAGSPPVNPDLRLTPRE